MGILHVFVGGDRVVHRWVLAALLEEMKHSKVAASLESCETAFRYSPGVAGRRVEASTLGMKLATYLLWHVEEQSRREKQTEGIGDAAFCGQTTSALNQSKTAGEDDGSTS